MSEKVQLFIFLLLVEDMFYARTVSKSWHAILGHLYIIDWDFHRALTEDPPNLQLDPIFIRDLPGTEWLRKDFAFTRV